MVLPDNKPQHLVVKSAYYRFWHMIRYYILQLYISWLKSQHAGNTSICGNMECSSCPFITLTCSCLLINCVDVISRPWCKLIWTSKYDDNCSTQHMIPWCSLSVPLKCLIGFGICCMPFSTRTDAVHDLLANCWTTWLNDILTTTVTRNPRAEFNNPLNESHIFVVTIPHLLPSSLCNVHFFSSILDNQSYAFSSISLINYICYKNFFFWWSIVVCNVRLFTIPVVVMGQLEFI